MKEKMTIQHRVQKFAGGIQSNKYISSITNALMSLLPVTIVGAIGSLINGIPIDAYQNFLVNTGLKTITAIPNELTNNLIALYAVFLIAYKFADSYEQDGVTAGMVSLMAFLLVTPYQVNEAGAMSGLNVQWLGAPGLFSAFIISLFVAKLYTTFAIKGWTIKMPDGVPPTVSKSFSGLIPSFIVMFIMLGLRYVFSLTPMGDIHTVIFSFIAAPLTSLGASFPAMLIAVIVAHLLWVFGIHGAMIVLSVFMAIWQPLGIENLAAYNAGQQIPHLISMPLFFQAITMGSGATLGLSIAMMRGKSQQYKTLGKLAVVPNACGINEPIIFATPIVMNFTLAIPFIVTPVVIFIVAYFGMVMEILPKLPGLMPPLGMPVILSGLFAAGGAWEWAVFQALTIVFSYVMYKPFFNKLDRIAYAQETSGEQA